VTLTARKNKSAREREKEREISFSYTASASHGLFLSSGELVAGEARAGGRPTRGDLMGDPERAL
jgi:hypothetical protein